MKWITSQLAIVGDVDSHGDPPTRLSNLLYGTDHIRVHLLNDHDKDDMLHVKPLGLGVADEELEIIFGCRHYQAFYITLVVEEMIGRH